MKSLYTDFRLSIAFIIAILSLIWFSINVLELKEVISQIIAIIILVILWVALFRETSRVIRLNRKSGGYTYNNLVFEAKNQDILSNDLFKTQILMPLIHLSEKKEPLDYKNIISLEFNRYSNKNAHSRYLMGTMIILGLLGTFIGLRSAIAPLQSLLGNTNLDSAFTQTFGGISTIFMTSILGILASLSLGFINSWSNTFVHALFIDFECFVQIELLPQLNSLVQSEQKELIGEVRNLNKKIEILFEKNVQELVFSVKENTDQTAQHLKEMQRAFIENLKLLDEDFERKLRQNHAMYLSELKENHNEYREDLQRNFNTMTTSYNESLNGLMNQVKVKVLELIQLNKEDHTALTEYLSKTSENLFQKLNGEADIVISKFQNAFNASANQYREGMKEYIASGRNLLEEGTTQLIEVSGKNLEQFSTRMGQILKNQEETIISLQNSSAEVLRNMQQKSAEYGANLNNLEANIQQMLMENYQKLSSLLDLTVQKITQTDHWIEALSENQSQTQAGFRQAFQKGVEEFTYQAQTGLLTVLEELKKLNNMHTNQSAAIQQQTNQVLQDINVHTLSALDQFTENQEKTNQLLEKNREKVFEFLDTIEGKSTNTSLWLNDLQASQQQLFKQHLNDLTQVRAGINASGASLDLLTKSLETFIATVPDKIVQTFALMFDELKDKNEMLYQTQIDTIAHLESAVLSKINEFQNLDQSFKREHKPDFNSSKPLETDEETSVLGTDSN